MKTKVTLDVWQYKPEPPDDEPCFMTYRLAGTINGRPFCSDVSMEIDGRDGEFEVVWGPSIAPADNPDAWDAVLNAMCENAELTADMEKRSTEYFGN